MPRPDPAEVADLINSGRHLVPRHMWGGVERYYLHGVAPGDFLTALLCNDLMEAFARADDDNTAAMRDWCRFLYNYTPAGSFGSPTKFRAWLAQFTPREEK